MVHLMNDTDSGVSMDDAVAVFEKAGRHDLGAWHGRGDPAPGGGTHRGCSRQARPGRPARSNRHAQRRTAQGAGQPQAAARRCLGHAQAARRSGLGRPDGRTVRLPAGAHPPARPGAPVAGDADHTVQRHPAQVRHLPPQPEARSAAYCWPKPPPPGVSTTKISPGCICVLAICGSASTLPSTRSTVLRPVAPGAPPAMPNGA